MNDNSKGEHDRRDTGSFLLRSFHVYIWLGIILVLLSIILDQYAGDKQSLIIRIAVDFVSTIGVAILVAGIFTFCIGTNTFLSFISEMLQKIVVNRAFLRNMDDKAKKNMLRSVLRPSDQQRDAYGNIESYYTHHIERSMEVAGTSVRSNYNSSCYVYYGNVEKGLVCEYTNNYRVFPSQGGYDDITVGFYGEDGTMVSYESLTLFFPDGNLKKYSKQDLESITPKRNEQGDERINVNVAEIASKYPHVDVEFRVLQRGYDHWIQIGFQALQPTDGFRFSVHCEDPLEIKEEQTFIYGAERTKEPNNVRGCGRAVIACQQWIDQGAGVSMLVAAPHRIPQELHKTLAERSHNKRKNSQSVEWRPLVAALEGEKKPVAGKAIPITSKASAEKGESTEEGRQIKVSHAKKTEEAHVQEGATSRPR